MRARPHRTLTPLALAILRLLHERPMHPYEMHQLVRDRGTDFVIKVRAGSLYHAVERLATLSLIAPVETGRDGRRPERTVYAITDAGRDEFMDNLRDLVRSPAEEFPVFAAALEMLATIEPAAARRLLMQRTFTLEAQVAGSRAGGRRAREVRSRSHRHRRDRIRPTHAAGRVDMGAQPDRRHRRGRDRLVTVAASRRAPGLAPRRRYTDARSASRSTDDRQGARLMTSSAPDAQPRTLRPGRPASGRPAVGRSVLGRSVLGRSAAGRRHRPIRRSRRRTTPNRPSPSEPHRRLRAGRRATGAR